MFSHSSLQSLPQKKKRINFKQYARLLFEGPKNGICETASDAIFVIDTSFTTEDIYFKHAIAEVCDAFNAAMKYFGYTQQVQQYDPAVH